MAVFTGMLQMAFLFLSTTQLSIATTTTKTLPTTKTTQTTTNKKRVCFYTNWSQFRKPPARFLPEDIEHRLCTHIVYAFASVNAETFEIEKNEQNDDEMIARVDALKKENPDLRTVLSVGGWSHDGKIPRFSRMVAKASRRKTFIRSTVKFLQKHNFNGLDIDWEWPGGRGSPPSDRQRYTLLLQELRAAFAAESNRTGDPVLLLSASVSASPKVVPIAYDATAIAVPLDWINLMSYALHGAWQKKTGCATSMTGPLPTVPEALDVWLKQGIPPEKISLGLAAYGQSFYLENADQHYLGAPVLGPGMAGNYTQAAGSLSHYEICNQYWSLKVDYTKSDCGIPYAEHRLQWVSYDTPATMRIKVKYLVVKHKLAGISFWSLDQDDFTGKFCGGKKVKFPLLQAVNLELGIEEANVKDECVHKKGQWNKILEYWCKTYYCVNGECRHSICKCASQESQGLLLNMI